MDFNPCSTISLPSNYIIALDKLQYLFYQSQYLNICAPDGSRLQTIGYGIKKSEIESTIFQLKQQIYVMECLLSNLHSKLELPAQAVSAMADLLCGLQEFCRHYIK